MIPKFRAWDGTEMFYDVALSSDGRVIEVDGEDLWFFHDQSDLTVMVSTGIADVHGCDIYDGDILEMSFGGVDSLWEVYWDKNFLEWKIKNERDYRDTSLAWMAQEAGAARVLDNIFENKLGLISSLRRS